MPETGVSAPPGLRVLWLAYARAPEGPPPRRWRGLVGYGRLDIAARLLLAALYPGGRLLEDTGLILFLDRGSGEGEALVFEPSCMPAAMEEEREASELLLTHLRGSGGCHRGPASLRGLTISARRRGYRVLLLREDGAPLRPEILGEGVAFVLGTRVDPPEEGLVLDGRVSVGCMPYLASSVVAYINLLRLETLSLPGIGGRDDG